MNYEVEIDEKWIPFKEIEDKIKTKCVWESINGCKIRRKLINSNYITTKVNFQPIFVEPSNEIIRLIIQSVKKHGLKKFMKELNLSIVRFYSWKGKHSWISIDAIERACDILNLNILEVLEGKFVRSGGSKISIPFTTKLNRNRAVLLAWLCMEGHLAILSPQIDIPQDDIRSLKRIHRLFQQECGVKGKIHTIKGKKVWRLLICSAPLRYIFCKYFSTPIGYKCSRVRIPKQIFSSNEEIQKAFISGCVETDGTVYGHKTPRRKYVKPVFNLEIISENFIKDFARLLNLFDYKFSVFTNSRPICKDYKTYNLQIGSLKNFKKLYSDISEHMINRRVKDKMKDLILQSN